MTQLQAFLGSVLIEVSVVVFVLNRAGIDKLRSASAASLATCLTHPIAWSCSEVLITVEYRIYILWIELVVVLVESIVLKLVTKTSWQLATSTALIANASSYFLGFLL